MDWDVHHDQHGFDEQRRFNSPVGIRWIGTAPGGTRAQPRPRFQFPSRNSMDWDSGPTYAWPTVTSLFQFPSRNSMDWDIQRATHARIRGYSFNSPVGIRWIGTREIQRSKKYIRQVSIPQSEFDGLGRNKRNQPARNAKVSIPQSEFDGLGLFQVQ